jgi:hypothetical protein
MRTILTLIGLILFLSFCASQAFAWGSGGGGADGFDSPGFNGNEGTPCNCDFRPMPRPDWVGQGKDLGDDPASRASRAPSHGAGCRP